MSPDACLALTSISSLPVGKSRPSEDSASYLPDDIETKRATPCWFVVALAATFPSLLSVIRPPATGVPWNEILSEKLGPTASSVKIQSKTSQVSHSLYGSANSCS